MDKRYIYI